MTSNMTLPFPQLAHPESQRWFPSYALPAEETNCLTKRTESIHPHTFLGLWAFSGQKTKWGCVRRGRRLFKKCLCGFHLAIWKGWRCVIPEVLFHQWFCAGASVLPELSGEGFCWVIFWARILPGNLGWWWTCDDFTLRGHVVSFVYWGHDVCILDLCFPYYWMIGVTSIDPCKIVWNDGMYSVYRHAGVFSREQMEKVDHFFCSTLLYLKWRRGVMAFMVAFNCLGKISSSRGFRHVPNKYPRATGLMDTLLLPLVGSSWPMGSEGFAVTFHIVPRMSMVRMRSSNFPKK